MTALRQYLQVWRIPGAPALLIVGTIGRFGIGMTPLALLLLVERATGRYAPAAIASGVYALAIAAIGPVSGRVADRIGPTPVLLATAVAHPLALLALLAATRAGADALPAIYLVSAVAGATYPPMTAAIRSAWNDLTSRGSGRHPLRTAALAAETSLFEIVFVLGPLLVAILVLVSDVSVALLAAAAVTLVGTVPVALGRVMRARRPHPGHTRTTGLGPLRVTGMPALLFCAAGLGTAFGVAGVAVPAYAAASVGAGVKAESLAGILLAVWGVGSAIGGVWFGARPATRDATRQFAFLLSGVAATFVIFTVMPGPTALGVALTVGGAAIAPALTAQNALVGRITPVSMLNEAYTWVVTVAVGSSAAGGALAGVIVDQLGVRWSFISAALAVAAGAAVAALPSGPIARGEAEAALRLESQAGARIEPVPAVEPA